MTIKKITLVILSSLVMIMPLKVNSFAEELDVNSSNVISMLENKEDVIPFLVSIATYNCNLTINGGNAVVTGSVSGKLGIKSTSVTCKLQKLESGKWTTIKTFTKKTGKLNCYSSNTYSGIKKGSTYRGVAVVTADKETKTITSASQKY